MKRRIKYSAGISLVAAIAISVSAWADETPDFSSKQMQGVEQVTIDVDLDGAVKRLSRAVQFPTISNQDRNDFDTKAFDDYHAFLVEAYPEVHKTLKREILGDPRPYSLLYTWEGKNPDLPPALFYAHQDVVPVPEDSLDQWEQEPFSGAVVDGYLWGRGTMDDKNQIHGILEAAEMKILKLAIRISSSTMIAFLYAMKCLKELTPCSCTSLPISSLTESSHHVTAT